MRNNKLKNSKIQITKYLPVFIILIAVTILIGSTLAYFTDREDEEETLTFGKVELSSATNPGVSGVIHDAIPGTELVDGKIEFSKSIDSAPIYVRAKVSFTLVNQNNTAMVPYLEALRNAEEIGLITTTQNGNAVWSAKEGNYYYLLDSADNTKLKVVDTIDTYVLTNSFIVPRDLEQLPNLAQYMESVRFNLAFEAIQAANVENNMSEVKEIFNQTFPESANEKIVYYVTLNDGTDTTITTINYGAQLSEPTVSKDGYTLEGWYTKDGSVSGDWGERVTFPMDVNKSSQIYAKWVEEVEESGTVALEVVFNGTPLRMYIQEVGEPTGDFVYESVGQLYESFTADLNVAGIDLSSNTLTVDSIDVSFLNMAYGELVWVDSNDTTVTITNYQNVVLKVVENEGVYSCSFNGSFTDEAGTHVVEVILILLNVA